MGVSEEEGEDVDEEDDDDDEEEVEWEDFMSKYWKSIGNNNSSSSASVSFPLQSKSNTIAMEDTDMKPCEIEPDLDEELNALSPIRTGCMDIDMDFNDDDDDDNNGEGIANVRSNNNNDGVGMNQLSMIGLECSRAMANVVVAIVKDSSSNNKIITSSNKKQNGMEGLRIDVGRIERSWGGGGRSASGDAKARNNNNDEIIRPSERNNTIGEGGNNSKDTSPTSSPNNSNQPMMNTASARQRLVGASTSATDTPEVVSSMLPPQSTTISTIAPQSTYQLQTTAHQQQPQLDAPVVKSTTAVSIAANVDIIDDSASVGKKSTKSSTTGAEEGGGGGATNNWKHNTSPLPSPERIHATGPIMTRTSLRSLVMKKWHPSYWMQYGTHELLIFRSKDHMDDWSYNPYHGKKQRDFLVKLHIDFMADMIPAVVAAEGGGGSKTISTKEGILGHRILPVKKKSYGKNEDEM